ncbi:MAG: tetratricopeptide repeat protein [Melioribacteraceae bacterium]|nr:tetratricopeptide repeat protein [Melioribacteraceae bacterium]
MNNDEEYLEDALDDDCEEEEEFINPCQSLIDSKQYLKAIECLKYNYNEDYWFKYFDSILMCYEKLEDYEGFFDYCIYLISNNLSGDYFVEYSLLPVFKKHYGEKDSKIKLRDFLLNSLLPKDVKYKLIVESKSLSLPEDEEINYFQELVELNPKNIDAIMNLGFAYCNSKDYSKAIETFEKALAIDDKNVKNYLELANVYQKLNDKKNELKCLLKALEISPNNEMAKFQMSLFHGTIREKTQEEIKDNKQAKTAYNKIWGHYNKGIEETENQNYLKAIEEFTSAIRLGKEHGFPDALEARGIAKIKMGNWVEGLEDFRILTQNDAYLIKKVIDEAIVHYHAEEFDSALLLLSVIIKLYPQNDDAYYWRGKVYLKKNEKNNATKDFNEALNLGRIGVQKIIEHENLY